MRTTDGVNPNVSSDAMLADIWLREKAVKWRASNDVPGADLAHVCTDIIPAIMCGTKGVKFVGLAINYVGPSGVQWMREILRWNFDELPDAAQILVVTEKARRECIRVASCSRVSTVRIAVLDKPQASILDDVEDDGCDCYECQAERKRARAKKDAARS